MSVALVTGSAGLIGAEASRHFAAKGFDVIGLDNDMRSVFFGSEASTAANRAKLEKDLANYRHVAIDIRDRAAVEALVRDLGDDLALVVHTAAQPSHDWAARDVHTDFSINATGTLTLLEAVRNSAPEAVFIFTSTNKVYGDTPNALPLQEHATRWELPADHTYFEGIREDMSVDSTMHSVFGASKLAADVMVQEFGRYFGLRTACFRGGTLTGPAHAATELHGFLAYLMRCTLEHRPYRVFGYGGKQVRDAIHSRDLIAAFDAFFEAPRSGEVYNMGGGRTSNVSVMEAIELCESIAGVPLAHEYVPQNRQGDHIWWISSNARFAEHYPTWKLEYDVPRILQEIHDANVGRWLPTAAGAR